MIPAQHETALDLDYCDRHDCWTGLRIAAAWLARACWDGPGVALFFLVTAAFLRLIKMIIAPLVSCTLSVGVARMDGSASIVRIGARTIGWFLFATLISMSIGLAAAHLFQPGLGMSSPAIATAASAPVLFEPLQVMEHIIPASVFQAMAANEILQIVRFPFCSVPLPQA